MFGFYNLLKINGLILLDVASTGLSVAFTGGFVTFTVSKCDICRGLGVTFAG